MKRFFLFLSLLAACMTGLAQDSDRPLRIAVAGVTHDHLWNVANVLNRGDLVVVGVWEPDDAYRKQNILTGKVPDKVFYADLDRMLRKTKPEVVVCYGPIIDHVRMVRACAPLHIDVMVEKPLATTYRDALEIDSLARKFGIRVLTNYETSWYSSNAYAKELMDEGKMGKVFRMEVYDGHKGPIEIGCSKRFTNWLTDPEKNGGGAVIDFGCYGVNLATWLFHGEPPVSVSAVLRTNKPGVYPKVDDDAAIVLNYKDAVVTVMGSWCWPQGRKDMYIYGLDGQLHQKNSTDMTVRLRGDKEARDIKVPVLKAPYDDSFAYLKAVVRGKIDLTPTDLASLENNVLVVRILEAAKESARTGRSVRL